ncbi:MAG TPA: thioredoxin domain-containing protein [Chloroflexota bacterium]|nr:thioredoxin domain-containing protein [Chloroflexota bacterium]
MTRSIQQKHGRRPHSRAAERRPSRRWWLAVVVAALAVVGGLVLLGQAQPGATAAAVATAGKVKGDPAAPVTIAVWADFQCPACRLFALGPGRQVEERYVKDGTAKLVWHNLAFLGQESVWAAEAADCADAQGRFWDYHDKLYAEQTGENRGAFGKDNLKRFAADLGLDQAAFNACLDSDRYAGQVKAERDAGRQQGVSATPTLFINGQKIQGAPPFEQLAQLITAQAAAARTRGEARP